MVDARRFRTGGLPSPKRRNNKMRGGHQINDPQSPFQLENWVLFAEPVTIPFLFFMSTIV
jgi:hypothetical protein